MEALFLRLFNLSVQAGFLTLAVLAARALTSRTRMPKSVRCLMWALVGLRLICPFSVESAVSLLPGREVISVESSAGGTPEIHTGVPALDEALGGALVPSQPAPAEPSAPAISPAPAEPSVPAIPSSPAEPSAPEAPAREGDPLSALISLASRVWLAGMAALTLYFVLSDVSLRRRVRRAVETEPGVWESGAVPSPFVFGAVRPRIYLPLGLDPRHREYVLAHERAHIQRRDYLFKPLAFLLLAVYWFDSLMWLSYVLLTRDIELACDERVLRKLGPGAKKPYSQALLAAVSFHRHVAACPVAFGEGKLTGRVKNVLRWKKPVLWMTAASLLLCAVLAACFLTDPKEGAAGELTDADIAGEYTYTGAVPPELGPNVFGITLFGDHRYSYCETIFSDYIGIGTWEYADGVVTLTETRHRLVGAETVDAGNGVTVAQGGELEDYEIRIRFLADGETLTYIAEGDCPFTSIDVADGDVFRRDGEAAPGETQPQGPADGAQEPAELSWTLEDGVLTVSGAGPMEDYGTTDVQNAQGEWARLSTAPWGAMGDDITSVVIGEGVTSVGKFAFYKLENLERVTLPQGLTTLGILAFGGCQRLARIDLPDSVTEIGHDAFQGCAALTHIRIPAGMTEIGEDAFSESGLTEVDIPSTVTAIGDGAFRNCAALRRVTVPGSVKTIGDWAFGGCGVLESVALEPGLQSIGESAFAYAYSLRDITLPEGLKSLGRMAFSGAGLYTATVPGSLRYESRFENAPFFYCHFLTDVYYGGTWDELALVWANLWISPTSDSPAVTVHMPDGTSFPAQEGNLGAVGYRGGKTHLSELSDQELTAILKENGIDPAAQPVPTEEALAAIRRALSTLEWDSYTWITYGQTWLDVLDARMRDTVRAYYGLPREKDGDTVFETEECAGVTFDLVGRSVTYRDGDYAMPELGIRVTSGGESVFYPICPVVEDQGDEYRIYGGRIGGYLTVYDLEHPLLVVRYPTPDGTLRGYFCAWKDGRLYTLMGSTPGNPWGAGIGTVFSEDLTLDPKTQILADNGTGVEYLFIFHNIVPNAYVGPHFTAAGAVPEMPNRVKYYFAFTNVFPILDPLAGNGSVACSFEDGTLTISGSGPMEDYIRSTVTIPPAEYEEISCPWYGIRDQIRRVVIEEGVTSIGAYAFFDCKNLREIALPSTLRSVGECAFTGCSSLASVPNVPAE